MSELKIFVCDFCPTRVEARSKPYLWFAVSSENDPRKRDVCTKCIGSLLERDENA